MRAGRGKASNPTRAWPPRPASGAWSSAKGRWRTLRSDKSFDLVSLIQVLAHVVDVREALGAVAALTRTDGHCLIETWNVESWTARFLGRHWHEYSPPSVAALVLARQSAPIVRRVPLRTAGLGASGEMDPRQPCQIAAALQAAGQPRHAAVGEVAGRDSRPAVHSVSRRRSLLDAVSQAGLSRPAVSPSTKPASGMRLRGHGLVCLVIAGLALLHAWRFPHSEPIFGGDESRHVMTGVFFRDLLCDAPVDSLQDYAERYYAQYPALGLLVWPPLFHFLEGAVDDWLAGTSATAGRVLVAVFALLASVSLYRLVGLTHDRRWAAGAVALFGASPMIFTYSHFAMLEIPTLAWSLTAIFYFVRYLETLRRRDVLVAAVCSAFAALTRYDAAFLLPLFLLLVGLRKQWTVCWRKEVLASAALALLLVVPCYAVCFRELGCFARAAGHGVRDARRQPAGWRFAHLWFYPARIPEQVGWFVAVAAVARLGRSSASPEPRRQDVVYYAILAATYLTFTPLAELGTRHTIYWVPALAVLALRGVQAVRRRAAAGRTAPGGGRAAAGGHAGDRLGFAGALGPRLRSGRAARGGRRADRDLLVRWLERRHLHPCHAAPGSPAAALGPARRQSPVQLHLRTGHRSARVRPQRGRDPGPLGPVRSGHDRRGRSAHPAVGRAWPSSFATVLDRHPQQFSLEAVFPVTGSRGLRTSLKVYRNRQARRPPPAGDRAGNAHARKDHPRGSPAERVTARTLPDAAVSGTVPGGRARRLQQGTRQANRRKPQLLDPVEFILDTLRIGSRGKNLLRQTLVQVVPTQPEPQRLAARVVCLPFLWLGLGTRQSWQESFSIRRLPFAARCRVCWSGPASLADLP